MEEEGWSGPRGRKMGGNQERDSRKTRWQRERMRDGGEGGEVPMDRWMDGW